MRLQRPVPIDCLTDRRVVVAAAEARAHRFGCAASRMTVVVAGEGVADGGLDADARRAARHDQVLNPRAFEELIELSLVEAAEASLVEDRVVVAWCELVGDVGAPRVAREHTLLDAEVKKKGGRSARPPRQERRGRA